MIAEFYLIFFLVAFMAGCLLGLAVAVVCESAVAWARRMGYLPRDAK